ncbi:MAG: SusC/RagA family protein, partial [Bacteroidales bacterium]|nr:SusC/RagA family protein [Bacteroidales bacterium]
KHTGGMGNTFTFKNWVFDIYFDWALGYQSYNGLEAQILKNIFAGNANLTKWVYKCWDPETNPDSEFMMYKGCDADDLNKNVQSNQYFVQDNDYLCIRDVSLSYNLNTPWLKRANIQNILLSVSGHNLKYFSDIKGINPELGSSNTYGTGFATYPAIRKISFGAKITF